MLEAYQDNWRDWPPSPASVEAAKDGHSAALHAMLAASIPRLVAFYRGLGIPKTDAEDIAADTCEAVVKYLPRLRDPVTFEAWFWRIARNKFNDHLRRKHRPRPDQGPDVSFDLPDEGLIVGDDHEEVRRAFLQLGTRDRQLLWMRDVTGLRYADMAGRLRLSEGSIRIAVMRARRKLETALLDFADE
jgi:RNA polymerase sigma-70 factor (ECF subfamily)